MAKNKKSVLLYCDIIHTIEKMDDVTAGLFFKHYLRYINDLKPVTDNMLVELTFESVKQNLKRDLAKYENICKRNSLNGSKGGRPKKSKKPNGLIGNPEKPKKADTDNDNDNDNGKVININNTTSAKADGIDFDLLLKFINKKTKRQFKKINLTVRAKYNARLKDGYTKADIFRAVEQSVKEDYNQKNNFKYLTPEYYSRANTLDLFTETTTNAGLSIKEQTAHIKNNTKNSL